MGTREADRLVDDYLRRLESAAAHLQRSRRTELVGEIREHIEAALREDGETDEVAVRNVLERLGRPEEIVAADEPPPEPRTGKLEIAGLVALVVPFVGWIVGIVLVVLSRAWSTREKAVGILLAVLPAFIPLIGLVASSSSGSEVVQGPVVISPGDVTNTYEPASSSDGGLGLIEVAVFGFLFLAGLPSAVFLGWRLRRRHA
jgi:hypothetical protein